MDTHNPKVSILVPVYNADKFIRRTINSALNQTFADLEVIIVDDGSKDQTGEIVSAMRNKDPRVSYFYQANQGLAHTRNRLINLSRGEYIAFLDHDDEWLPEKIEKQLKLFENDRKLGLVFCDAYIMRDGKMAGTCFKERKPFRGNIFYRYLFSDNFAPLLTVISPRKVLLEFMPFDSRYEISEEFDMFLKIARKYKFDFIDEPLAIYHLHGSNSTISRWRQLIKDDFDILDSWIEKDATITQVYSGELERRLSYLYYKEGACLLREGDLSKTKDAILSSFKHRFFNFNAFKLAVKLVLKIINNFLFCKR